VIRMLAGREYDTPNNSDTSFKVNRLRPTTVTVVASTRPAGENNDTFMIGIGARVRVRPAVYVVGEVSPRIAGYKQGVAHGGFAIEKRAGGRQFQLNFSDSFGTTMGQIAHTYRHSARYADHPRDHRGPPRPRDARVVRAFEPGLLLPRLTHDDRDIVERCVVQQLIQVRDDVAANKAILVSTHGFADPVP
jgi:hypothetical protein